ncbi:MAG: lysophospholipid acyltransferase family protein [Thermodesulfobacteriota bacterium]
MKERSRSYPAGLFLSVINLIPLKWRISLFEGLSRLIYALDDRHRRIALRGLTLAFPEKDLKERNAIARSAFRNLARVAAEFFSLPRLNEKNFTRYITFEGLENFQKAYEKEKGILILTAHFGNWEWMAALFPLQSHHPVHVVVRPLDSRFLDSMVEQLRMRTGNQAIPKQKAMGQILRLLKAGEIVGILLDQNMAWQEGVFVDFFGEKACTNTGMALLALKTGTPVLPAFNIRQKDGRYRVVIEPEIPLVRTGDKERDVTENTQRFTQIIERYVRNYPDQWLWLHQRWKTRPWQAGRAKSL